jgi:putative RNA 2'-phosphotransferase
VKLEAKKVKPPDILLHGTSIDNKEKILKSGLSKMSRHHVHLTDNEDVAFSVGIRYAKYNNKVWIIKIDAKQMNLDGYDFFVTENNVYLTDHVPSKYFIK